FVDGRGRSFVPKTVLQSIAAQTAAPVFGPYEPFMGHGIVGGPLISLHKQGQAAARKAVRLLLGEEQPGAAFDFGESTTVTLYDWRQLKRHAIDEGLVPDQASILFREATLWDQYKQVIIGVALLVVFQTLLIVGLIVNLRHRKLAEQALRQSQRELQTLAGRLISSQEEELSRLSREFHDDYAQRLAALAIEAGTLEIQAERSDSPLRERIVHVKTQLINLSDDIHALSRELHPAILKDLGLERALNALCRNFSDREEIEVGCHFEPVPEDIDPETALCVYRVIQEGLRNIAKHARARHVDIYLQPRGSRLQATIEDDGVGFEPKCVRHTPGIGLASMRERVQFVHGEFTVESEPGHGTVIDLAVPLFRRDHEKTENPAGR
ncbi:MAG: sensor histidine kinase, partial [Desulfobulbaceae bacterium]|nr:sensor histidine kinase [Desulfobulbaceae bacterium]